MEMLKSHHDLCNENFFHGYFMVWCSWVVNLFMGSSWGSTHEMLKFSWVLPEIIEGARSAIKFHGYFNG